MYRRGADDVFGSDNRHFATRRDPRIEAESVREICTAGRWARWVDGQ